MTEKERLYERLGELLYVVAMADGVIQPEERAKLEEILHRHPWAKEISWSFQYEANKQFPVEETYNKVISFCHGYGPAPEYEEFIECMEAIAEASEGTCEDEQKVIQSFSRDLCDRFIKDMERVG